MKYEYTEQELFDLAKEGRLVYLKVLKCLAIIARQNVAGEGRRLLIVQFSLISSTDNFTVFSWDTDEVIKTINSGEAVILSYKLSQISDTIFQKLKENGEL